MAILLHFDRQPRLQCQSCMSQGTVLEMVPTFGQGLRLCNACRVALIEKLNQAELKLRGGVTKASSGQTMTEYLMLLLFIIGALSWGYLAIAPVHEIAIRRARMDITDVSHGGNGTVELKEGK